MAKRIHIVAAVLALAFSVPAFSQTPAFAQPLVVPASVTVEQLAPQLVAFAGSSSNFQSLVNGLAQGLPVTLVTLTADGLTQTVTFTPAVSMTALDIARTLEVARQNLISRGVATPTAEQLGVTLAGGSLPTPLGAVPLAGLIPVGLPASAIASASRGSSAIAAPATSSGGLVIQINPAPGQLQGAATPATSTPVPRFTSDSPLLRNTSDTPVPAILSPLNTSASPAVSASASPSFNTSNSPVLAPPAGAPSPAVQMQNRR
jgi:hypothetical protein